MHKKDEISFGIILPDVPGQQCGNIKWITVQMLVCSVSHCKPPAFTQAKWISFTWQYGSASHCKPPLVTDKQNESVSHDIIDQFHMQAISIQKYIGSQQ